MQLTKRANIGNVLANKLKKAGIKTVEELEEVGSVDAYKRIKTSIDPEACLNHLYALEGAIKGIRWHSLTEEDKKKLRESL